MTTTMKNHARSDKAITIAATATAVPSYIITRDEVKTHMKKVFSLESPRLDVMMAVIEHSQIDRRYSIHPVETIIASRPLEQISREYQEHAVSLGRRVASECLAEAGMKPTDIDTIITTSCTGVMIPSLDAHLVNDLGFRSDVRRLPITELGCAAGAASVSLASQFIRARPGSSVLIVAVELPSLTFQRKDHSPANLISCALFGDGAAATIVTGRPTRGPRILDVASHFFPHSIDAMGFDLKDGGLHIVLSKDVPELIRSEIKELVAKFLERNAVKQEQISAFVLHPGGQKLLSYMEEELGLCRCGTQFSWDVLRDYGNLSSASVLFVLREWLTKKTMGAGEYGLMAAFGPGFSAEMLLLQWT